MGFIHHFLLIFLLLIRLFVMKIKPENAFIFLLLGSVKTRTTSFNLSLAHLQTYKTKPGRVGLKKKDRLIVGNVLQG